MKSVVLTAKEKICFMEEADCSPENCPYAKGHYDRINDAVFDLLTTQESFDRERIEEYARRHQVCPFGRQVEQLIPHTLPHSLDSRIDGGNGFSRSGGSLQKEFLPMRMASYIGRAG